MSSEAIDPWHPHTIQREHEDRLRQVRRWIIAETEDGFEVHEWTSDSVFPAVIYPVKESAAARVLQLLDIKHAIVPQAYPEQICIGRIS